MGRSKRSKSTEVVVIKKKNKVKNGKRSRLDLIFTGGKNPRQFYPREEEPNLQMRNNRQRQRNGVITKKKTNHTTKEKSLEGKCKLPSWKRKSQQVEVPWLSLTTTTTSKKTDKFHNTKEDPFWRYLDQELEQFGEYVRLNEQECRARQQLVQTIRDIAHSTFAGKASCQIFGSFGVLPVCCFESDIDVAVFGVVETPEQLSSNLLNNHVRFGKKNAQTENKTAQVAQVEQKQQRIKSRAEKWKEALAAVDDANGITNGHEDTDSTGKTESDDSSSLPIGQPSLTDGTTTETAIDLLTSPNLKTCTDDSSGERNNDNFVTIDDSSDDKGDDSDSADKLETFFSRERSRCQNNRDEDDSSGYESSVSSNDETVLEDDMVVNMHVSQVAKPSPKAPPQWLRNRVLASLEELTRRLRKSKIFKTVIFIHRARVPIIKIATHYGFEIDVSIGGFGTDTSLYAKQQSEKYASFSVVVLFLKVLLSQQKLDTPFTGGLGSYKLYVLVAYHIHCHLAMGGSDRPGEILMSFLYRFGLPAGLSNAKDGGKRTHLDQQTNLTGIDGACADLSNVFRLDECLNLFRSSWERLKQLNSQRQQHQKRQSFLANLVCPAQLRIARDERFWKLKHCSMNVPASVPSSGEKRSLIEPQTSRKRMLTKSNKLNSQSHDLHDLTAHEIMARYGATHHSQIRKYNNGMCV